MARQRDTGFAWLGLGLGLGQAVEDTSAEANFGLIVATMDLYGPKHAEYWRRQDKSLSETAAKPMFAHQHTEW
jgi:hypothetical protein